MTTPLNTVVVGAGLAGITCARLLHEQGHQVTVFDKARGHGGRASTRRVPGFGGKEGLVFDLGSPRITARGGDFSTHVGGWVARGVAAPWPRQEAPAASGAAVESFAGVPGLSAVVREDAKGLDVRFGMRVGAVVPQADPAPGIGRFQIFDGALRRMATAHTVVIALPVPQARALVGASPTIHARLAPMTSHAGLVAMFAFDRSVGGTFDLREATAGGELELAIRESSKPGRGTGSRGEHWTLHASSAAAARVVRQLDGLDGPDDGPEGSVGQEGTVGPVQGSQDRGPGNTAESLAQRMFVQWTQWLGSQPPEPIHRDVHLWRAAKPVRPLGEPFLMDGQQRLAVCGDYCLGDDLQSAFLSGKALAERLLEDRRPLLGQVGSP